MNICNKVFSVLLVIMILLFPITTGFAHDMTPWANRYTVQNAGGYYHFAFRNANHVSSSSLSIYYSGGSSIFSSAMSSGASAWGGMISVSSGSNVNSSAALTYNPNYSADGWYAAVYPKGTGSGHYSPSNAVSIVAWKATYDLDSTGRKNVMMHELGHCWGITDLHSNSRNLISIYSQPVRNFGAPTRHDKNAMYIALNQLWYQESNGAWYYQPSPGVWQKGWKQISGYWYYFESNGVMATGWKQLGTKWYYLRKAKNSPGTGPAGSMLHSGWFIIDGKNNRFDSSGAWLGTA